MAIRIVYRREVGDVIFFVVVRLFDIWHSYVQMRNWLAVKNERLSSRIRPFVFNIFVNYCSDEMCLFNSWIISFWKKLLIYRRENLGLRMNLKNWWYTIWKMHDVFYQRKGQGLTTQANSSGSRELGREQLSNKGIEVHYWTASWLWIKNILMS